MSWKKVFLLCVIITGIVLAVQLIFKVPQNMPALAVALSTGAAAISAAVGLTAQK